MNVLKKLKINLVQFLIDHFPQYFIQRSWKAKYGHKIDWNNPKNLNEVIQWLICFSDISKWPSLTDKYAVREYVKSKDLEHILPQLYGVWADANDINLESLPEKFVLKCNHDSGSVYIIDKLCNDNIDSVKAELNKKLHVKFGYEGLEIHYNKIKPLIIAEEFLQSTSAESQFSKSLIDYKVWCFNGKASWVVCYYGRTSRGVYVEVHDLDWNYYPEYIVVTDHFFDGKGLVPRPSTLDKMIEAAEILSEGFPQVRADFYEVCGKLYFGELTFTSSSGRMDNFTDEFLKIMGDEVILPRTTR